MHKHHEYIEHIIESQEHMHELKEVVCEVLETLEHYCPEEHRHMMYKLHCIAYGPHFDERLAKKAVSMMKNVDGTSGEHWTLEQAKNLAEQHNIKCKADFYYVLNMLYSDFAEVMGGDIGTYVKLAKAYMNDPDAPEGKAFRIWYMIKHEK